MATLTTPGFWDLHLHGVAGIDFMNATPEGMAHACETLGKNGTAAFAPTLLTDEPRHLVEACARWGAFLERATSTRFLSPRAARPVGLHLEGPFLNPQMAGAHPRSFLKKPSAALSDALVKAARGHVAIVTLAPELAGAPALIRRLARQGVRVQLGHTVATAEEALRGVRAGATGLTHLHNAMRTHHRQPGVLTPLRRGLVTAELITDGVHLDPEFVLWSAQAARGQVYAVSDGCSAIGARNGQPLTLGSLKLKRDGLAAVVAANGVLAGGATFLVEHPALLRRRADVPKSFLKLYYGLQQKLFSGKCRCARLRNFFDAQTLKHLGVEGARSL